MRSFCLAIAAVAAAGAAASTASSGAESRGSFVVTLRGTIEQSASYKRKRLQGECAYVVSGRWNNKLELHSQKPTKLAVTTRSGRLRFSPARIVAVSGKLTTRGTVVAKAPGCARCLDPRPLTPPAAQAAMRDGGKSRRRKRRPRSGTRPRHGGEPVRNRAPPGRLQRFLRVGRGPRASGGRQRHAGHACLLVARLHTSQPLEASSRSSSSLTRPRFSAPRRLTASSSSR